MRLGLALLPAILITAIAIPAAAQLPPTDKEISIYAGLHAAAAAGDTAEIERLIKAGERVNIQDSRSRTPLLVAAYRGHRDAVRTLLRLGANANVIDSSGFDILTLAASQNDQDLLTIALEGGAKPTNITGPFGGTALNVAARIGHVEIVKALIEAKAPLDHVNQRGWTALIEAVALGNGGASHFAIVKALIDAGADVDIKDRSGRTALNYARDRRYSDMVTLLQAASGRRT